MFDIDPNWLEEHPLFYAVKDYSQGIQKDEFRDYLIPEKKKYRKHQIYGTTKYLAGFVNLGFIAKYLVKNDEKISEDLRSITTPISTNIVAQKNNEKVESLLPKHTLF